MVENFTLFQFFNVCVHGEEVFASGNNATLLHLCLSGFFTAAREVEGEAGKERCAEEERWKAIDKCVGAEHNTPSISSLSLAPVFASNSLKLQGCRYFPELFLGIYLLPLTRLIVLPKRFHE